MIGLDDIAAIPCPEGRAVALTLWNELQAAKTARAEELIQAGLVSPPVEICCEDDGTPFRDEYNRIFIRPTGQEPAIPGPWLHWRGQR